MPRDWLQRRRQATIAATSHKPHEWSVASAQFRMLGILLAVAAISGWGASWRLGLPMWQQGLCFPLALLTLACGWGVYRAAAWAWVIAAALMGLVLVLSVMSGAAGFLLMLALQHDSPMPLKQLLVLIPVPPSAWGLSVLLRKSGRELVWSRRHLDALEHQQETIAALEAELQVAHDLQMGLLPKASPLVSGCRSAGRCLPATQVGGDFYQYYHLQDRLSVALADVTGHGMGAAIPAVMFSGILDSQMRLAGDLSELFGRLNAVLRERLTSRTHVAFCMAEIDVPGHELRLANAGCPYPLHYRNSDRSLIELQVEGYPLGVKTGTVYRMLKVALEPGDYIVWHSDGIAEAADDAGSMYGFERTAAAIREACEQKLSPEAIIDHLLAAVRAFTGDVLQGDDMTCVVVRMET